MMKNNATKYINDYEVDSVRGAYENAARWYFYLSKEGLTDGLPVEFIYDAMEKSGEFYFEKNFKDIDDLPGFIDRYFDFSIEKVHEGSVVECTESRSVIEFGYCPFVGAWLKLTDDEDFIKLLCTGCHKMRQAMVENLGFSLDVEQTIASGYEKCIFTYKNNPSE